MTPPSLPDILARLAAATPGPWYRMVTYSPDGAEAPTRTVLTAAPSHDDYKAFIADAYREADADLITHAPADLAALAARVAALEAENAAQRAILADPRVAAALAEIQADEDAAVGYITGSPRRAALIARLTEIADGQPHPWADATDFDLYDLGLDCGDLNEIEATPSAARVLARLAAAGLAGPGTPPGLAVELRTIAAEAARLLAPTESTP
jgi:hypothetical protein